MVDYSLAGIAGHHFGHSIFGLPTTDSGCSDLAFWNISAIRRDCILS